MRTVTHLCHTQTHTHSYIYPSGGECDEGQKCDHILNELENIDDDTDDHGMHFVTTEETGLANNYGIKLFPALAIFRNGEPLLYKGELWDDGFD